VLNIGGVANLTYIDGEAALIACDIGPGNALIDDFLRLRTGSPHDSEGRAAAAGQVDEAAVERILAHPFFAKPPPKSLDRNAFHRWIAQDAKLAGTSLEDGAATLTAVTAAALARAVPLFPRAPKRFIVAGGGIRNPVLMRMLAERVAPISVESADAVGWSADSLEAQGFAYLAVRTLMGLPLSFPTTTGVPRAMAGGVLARPTVA
jgi:anhydro-N-acetylmuramic acid kinase